MFLDDSQEVAKILHNLIEGTEVSLWACSRHMCHPDFIERLSLQADPVES